MGLGEGDQRVGRLDPPLGLGDRLGAGADHHRLQLSPRLNCCWSWADSRAFPASKSCNFGRRAAIPAERFQAVERRPRPLDRHLGLLDRQLVGPPLLGPRQRLEQRQRGFEPIARRRLLGQVGLRDRLVQLDDRLPFLDRAALHDEQLVNVPLDRGSQGRDMIGQGLASAQALDCLDAAHPVSPARCGP